jgi:hypothetical protein
MSEVIVQEHELPTQIQYLPPDRFIERNESHRIPEMSADFQKLADMQKKIAN